LPGNLDPEKLRLEFASIQRSRAWPQGRALQRAIRNTMTVRTRVFVGILLVYALGVGVLMWRLLADIDPRYRESAEESLVETAHLMAAMVEQRSGSGVPLDTAWLEPLFRDLYARRFEADIFGVKKESVELRATVVDERGIVLFDSLGRHEGKDFSQWRDVRLALAGQYGARTSTDFDGDANTSVMVVAVPIRIDGRIVGAVSMAKPALSFGQFIEAARRKTLMVGLTSVVAVLLLVVIVSAWLVRPFGMVIDYLRYVRRERNLSLPRLGRRALGTLGAAYADMRDALAGGNYVADYGADVDSRTEESPVRDSRRGRAVARTRHARGRSPAFHCQRGPRNTAHPGTGRSHDGAHRAGTPPHARPHRAGGTARAAARPGHQRRIGRRAAPPACAAARGQRRLRRR
jgi:hypothetical protein